MGSSVGRYRTAKTGESVESDKRSPEQRGRSFDMSVVIYTKVLRLCAGSELDHSWRIHLIQDPLSHLVPPPASYPGSAAPFLVPHPDASVHLLIHAPTHSYPFPPIPVRSRCPFTYPVLGHPGPADSPSNCTSLTSQLANRLLRWHPKCAPPGD